MEETQLQCRVDEVIQTALTQMKCMVLRAKHLNEDVLALQRNPSREAMENFCQKHNSLLKA
jgi:hypothetical protein